MADLVSASISSVVGLQFLQTIDREVPAELGVHLVLDNSYTRLDRQLQRESRPFVWPKTADEILGSMTRYRTLINEARH